MQNSQLNYRQPFLEKLISDIGKTSNEESLSFGNASVRVVLDWLGYEIENISFIDQKDRGIDAWIKTDKGFDFFQVKVNEPRADSSLDLSNFNSQGVSDIARSKDFFFEEESSKNLNKDLKKIFFQKNQSIKAHKLEDNKSPLLLTFHLILLGNGLTLQANLEFKALQSSNAKIQLIEDVPVQVSFVLHTVNNIIDCKWRESNHNWIDSTGKSCESIDLVPWKDSFINDNANAIFYCRAIDLVTAFDNLGYQIFEPNVRANIKNSKVNQAIRDSVMHQRSRKEFRFLNNGVTITCDSFSLPKTKQKPAFNVKHPGVVNGLQTVVALQSAYHQLSPAERKDFEENCSVLVRLLMRNAVEDITQVVKATNNQNPMKPRNLVSNNEEQLLFIRIFAEELVWFYEAKQGAWDAFENDPRRWRPSLNKKKKDFLTPTRKVKKVDNSYLAQTWLSFIGFTNEAVEGKKALFEDRIYSIIFKYRTFKHGYFLDTVDLAKSQSEENYPDPSLMLVSFLTWIFANEVVPSSIENRRKACERLNIDFVKINKSELDSKLNKDNKFFLNQVLSGMTYLFTEFVGFVFFESFGGKIHELGRKILNNYSYKVLFENYTSEEILRNIEDECFNENDVLPILWLLFVNIIEDMINEQWAESYKAASSKPRFIVSKETRGRLYKKVQDIDNYMKRKTLKETWAIGANQGEGLFEFIKRSILTLN